MRLFVGVTDADWYELLPPQRNLERRAQTSARAALLQLLVDFVIAASQCCI